MTPKKDKELAELKEILSQVRGRADVLNESLNSDINQIENSINSSNSDSSDLYIARPLHFYIGITIVAAVIVAASVGALIVILNLISGHM